jgi:hypothetical protein
MVGKVSRTDDHMDLPGSIYALSLFLAHAQATLRFY